MKDVIIIGAGMAGLSAALSCAFEGLDVLLIEKSAFVGGQAALSPKIENLAGMGTISGQSLALNAFNQCIDMGVEMLLLTEVEDINKVAGSWSVNTSRGSFSTKTIIVATGMKCKYSLPNYVDGTEGIVFGDKPLQLADVLGKNVVVLGGGNSAGQWALWAGQFANSVCIVSRRRLEDTMSHKLVMDIATTSSVYVDRGEITALYEEDGKLKGVYVDDVYQNADILYVLTGYEACPKPLIEGLEMDEKNCIVTEGFCTNMEGVFAIGDVTGKGGRVAIAIGMGGAVTRDVWNYLQTKK